MTTLALLAVLALPALAACGRAGAGWTLDRATVAFGRDAIAVTLPADHPLTALELREGSGALLVAQPVTPGAPLAVRFEVDWVPAEALALVGSRAADAPLRRELRVPPRLPPPISVTLELPAGFAVSGGLAGPEGVGAPAPEPGAAGESPLFLPLGSSGGLALALRSEVEQPLRLRVRLDLPPVLAAPGWGAAGRTMAGRTMADRSMARRLLREIVLAWRGDERRIEVPFIVAGAPAAPGAAEAQGTLRWQVEGAGPDGLLAGSLSVMAFAPGRFPAGLELRESRFPAAQHGAPLVAQPPERIVLGLPWLERLSAALGWSGLRDPYLPYGFVRLVLENHLPGAALVLLRTETYREGSAVPDPAFGEPLMEAGHGAVLSLVRVPARGEATLAQPLYLDPRRIAPGGYRRCTSLIPWGLSGAAATSCVPLRVAHSSLLHWALLWGATALCAAAFLLALRRLPRWIGAFAPADLVAVALLAGLAFAAVALPGAVLRAAALLVTGPFAFLVEDLLFKLLLFLLLGSLFALVARPGVYLLFFGLWMVAQALLSGFYLPTALLFGAVSVTVIEAGLRLSGLVGRNDEPPRRVPWLRAALMLGACEALVIVWHLELLKVLYRQYFADWYVLAQAGWGGANAAAGMALGLRLGERLRGVRRPAPDMAPDLAPAAAGPGLPPRDAAAGVPALEVAGLSYGFPGRAEPVLREIAFTVDPGEIVLLAGATGSGKTTLLRLIHGLLPCPAGGRVAIGGADVRGWSPLARASRCGLLFQEPALQVLRPTVADDVALAPELQGRRDGAGSGAQGDTGNGAAGAAGAGAVGAGATVAEALRLFGLADAGDRATAELSGGELQRTALAGLWAAGPRLLLLDEPLASLDAEGRARLLHHLHEVRARGGAALVVEHRVEPLLGVADRVLWLEGGRLRWQGTPEAFRRTPYLAACTPRIAPAIAPAIAPRPHPHAHDTTGPAGATATAGGWPALIELRSVTFAHPGRASLFADVAATLLPGRAVALTGANGTGKSTLLDLMVGLVRPARGSVALAGRAAHRLPWRKRAAAVGYLPQQADLLLQGRTVAEELALPLRRRGLPAAERAAPLDCERDLCRWLDRLGLGEARHRFPHLLSRGERQRLALATVILGDPRALLLDEPFTGQDARQVESLLALCAEYLAGHPSRSLLITSHDLDPISAFFDETWHLEAGRLHVSAGAAGRCHPLPRPPAPPATQSRALGGAA